MTTPGLSNAASVVGRHIAFLDDTGRVMNANESAVIISYHPENNSHTVEILDHSTGERTERVVVLNKHRFKFVVRNCEASDTSGWKAKRLIAAQRDAVGRPIKVFSSKRNKYINGTITAFDEQSGKHAVTVTSKKGKDSVHHLDLQSKNVKWRYRDLIGNRPPGAQSIASSKYAGVARLSESSWKAYKGSIGDGGQMDRYIGTFKSEKDAARAHDYYARQEHSTSINFPNERLSSEQEVNQLKSNHNDYSQGAPSRGHGKCKYRGVHWQKNRHRWMARYTLAHKGQKNINLGAFESAEYAAMAFDFEARKRGRPECDLNFPDKYPTEEQIKLWSTNTAHYSMMRSGRKKSSQYRGVTWSKAQNAWRAQCNITKVVRGMGKEQGPVHLGCGGFTHEEDAALEYDRAYRKFGIPEKELNFPRNDQSLKEVRLFDDECYFCFQKSPTDPVATPCNHVFCRACIVTWINEKSSSDVGELSPPSCCCPCCKMPNLTKDVLRSITLIPNPETVGQNTATRKRKRKDKKNHEPRPAAGNAIAEAVSSSSSTNCHARTDPSEEQGAHDGTTRRRKKRKESRLASNAGQSGDEQETSPRHRKKSQRTRSNPRRAASATNTASLVKRDGQEGRAKYPIGTRFIKEFEGYGKFEGHVVDYDGVQYEVYYPEDGDEETLSEDAFEECEILDPVSLKDEDDTTPQEATLQPQDETEELDSDDEDDDSSIDSMKPTKFPIGTRFIKEFPGHGKFEGRVVDYDGDRYEVHYPEDGDEEVIKECELERLEIIRSKT